MHPRTHSVCRGPRMAGGHPEATAKGGASSTIGRRHHPDVFTVDPVVVAREATLEPPVRDQLAAAG